MQYIDGVIVYASAWQYPFGGLHLAAIMSAVAASQSYPLQMSLPLLSRSLFLLFLLLQESVKTHSS